MNSTTKTREFLNNWVNAETNPRFGVLIEGSWGAGKTHFIKSVLDEESFTPRNMVYVSLFGVNSIKDLETTLFFASASKAQQVAHRGASLMGSLLKGALRIDINSDGNDDGSVNADFKGLDQFIQNASKALADSFIILDDLERCSIPMSQLLGFCNQFIEHQDARFLFVANTDKLKGKRKKKFASFKEKVIGHSLKLTAQPEEALGAFTDELESIKLQEVFKDLKSQIIGLFHKSKYQNLRALRQFVWHYSRLVKVMDSNFLENKYLMQNLTEQYFVFFTEFKLDLGGNGLTTSNLKSGEASDKSSVVYAMGPTKNKQPSAKHSVLRKYSSQYGGYDTVIPVNKWIQIFETGLVNSQSINECVSNSKYAKTVSVPAWRALMSFDDVDDYNVDEAKQVVQTQFLNREVTDTGEMLHIFALHFMMAKHEIIMSECHDPQLKMQTVEDECKRYIDDLLQNGNLPPRPTDWRWPEGIRLEASYGFSYWVEDDYRERFNRIYEYLNDARIVAFHGKGADVAQEILSALRTDVDEFAKLISYKSDGGKYAAIPVMQHVGVVDLLDAWMKAPKDKWRTIRDAIDKRYETGRLQQGKELAEEREWAVALRKGLEAKISNLGSYQRLRLKRVMPNLPSVV